MDTTKAKVTKDFAQSVAKSILETKRINVIPAGELYNEILKNEFLCIYKVPEFVERYR